MASKKDKEHHYDEFDDVIMMKRIGQMASNMVKKIYKYRAYHGTPKLKKTVM